MNTKPAWAQRSANPIVKKTKRTNALTDALSLPKAGGRQFNTKDFSHKVPAATNFLQVLPDSHFWTDLSQLKNYLSALPQSATRDYLVKGIDNTINNGYELKKNDENRAGFGLNGNFNLNRFRLILATQRPKEIFHTSHANVPYFTISSYAVGAAQESSWYVRGYFASSGYKIPVKYTMSQLYNALCNAGIDSFFIKTSK